MPTRPGSIRRRFALIAALVATTLSAAGAATFHRLAATQTSGSGGATTFLQTSATGSALQGEVGSSADSGYPNPFGVFGVYDAPGSTFGIGVLGASTTGYGVAGESTTNQPSILAYPGGNGDGIDATTIDSSSASAAFLEAKGWGDGAIVLADKTGSGLNALSYGGTAVVGANRYGGVGYLGALDGTGVAAIGYSGGTVPALRIVEGKAGTDLLGVYNTNNSQTLLIRGSSANRSGATVTGASDVMIQGDVYVYGKIFQNCGSFPMTPSTTCNDVTASPNQTTSAVGRGPLTAEHAATAASERFGRGMLRGGRAFVSLGAAFARTLTPEQPYLVFLTPAGDSRGLYVTHRSLAGFEVRENGGGTTSMEFDYRIVRAPSGPDAADDAIASNNAGSVTAEKTIVAVPPDAEVERERARIAADRAHPKHLTIRSPLVPPLGWRR